MRELEAKATKEAEEKNNRDIGQEKEEQLMEERKKRKDDKKKKEALKKATEQKNKVPESIKSSSSQPQPANPNNGTSAVTSNISNAKRAAAASSQQQASPRYPPREVPPRFRHHEQKQLLKRGQQLPVLAANLGARAQVLNSRGTVTTLPASDRPLQNGNKDNHTGFPQADKRHSTFICSLILQGEPPIRDLVSHSPNQSDLNHGVSHYENSQWGPGSSGSDSNTNWDKVVVVDGCDKEAWPSITDCDPELASECIDTDSASNSGSEKNLSIMASGNAVGDNDGNRNGNGRSSQNHFMVENGSNNVSNGSINGPWGLSHGSMLSTCQSSVEGPNGKLTESSHGKINAWGNLGSSTNGGINPSTLNPNANHGAWPVLENNGHKPQGPVGSGNNGTNIQRSTIGQMPNNQSINSNMGGPIHGSWGSLQENAESEVNGTRKVSLSGQPQNLNTETNGPNNTTNMMTSSLPNSTGSMQMNELPNITGPRAWRMSTVNPSQLQASSVSNGTSISQYSNDEGIKGGSYDTTWGAPGTNYSGDKCPVPKGQSVGDTVNATLMQSTMNGSAAGAAAFKNSNGVDGRGGTWESGAVNSHNVAWGTGNSVGSGGVQRAWGSASSNTGTNLSNGEWNNLPNSQHSSDGMNGNGNRKGTNGWKSLEDDALCGQNSVISQVNEQNSVWGKSTATNAESEGSTESTGSQNEKMRGDEQRGRDRRKADPQGLIQNTSNRPDLDPCVLSNTGWGQTVIRQHTAWDIEASMEIEKKTDIGTEAWGGCVSQTSNSGGWGDGPSPNCNDTSSVSGWANQKPATGWGDTKGSNSQGGWDENSASTGVVKSNQSWGSSKEDKSSAWNDAQKVKQGWMEGQKSKQGWGVSSRGEEWGEAPRANQWGEPQKSGSGGWDSDSDRSVSGWSEPGRSGSGTNTWGGGGGGGGGSNNPNPSSASGWGEQSKTNNQPQGWGEPSKTNNQSQGWGEQSKTNQPQGWGEPSKTNQPQGWGEPSKTNNPPQSWGEPSKTNNPPQGWGEQSKTNNQSQGWGGQSKANQPQGWGEQSKANQPQGWGEPSNTNNPPQGWGEQSKTNNQSQGWGGQSKTNNQSQGWGEPSKPSNSPDWNKPQDVSGGSLSWGGALSSSSSATSKPAGWINGPVPASPKEEEPTGWEEPSPESIRRKMEIDDGTSAWGDPNKYKYKNVNMWNKNVANGSSGSEQEAQVQQQYLPQPPPSAMPNKENSGGPGWGEPYGVQPKSESSWGEPSVPPTTVDNGTSAWGKPMDTGNSWGEPGNETTGWSNTPVGQQPQNKPGPKPMQDGWCGDEMSMPGTRHPSWEEEEDVEIGMWNSNPSQEMNQPSNWPPYMKKMPPKGIIKGGNKQDDAWMNQFVKQFSNIGFSRDSSEEALKSNKMDMSGGMLQDKRMDMDKHGLNAGEYNVIGKGSGSRTQISKESSVERSPYYDKLSLAMSGHDDIVAEEPQNVHFVSNHNMKLPPSNNALPNQTLGSVAGLGIQNLNSVRQNGNPNMFSGSNAAAQARGMQQPPAQPLNSSQPNLRAQVPPPLLSPQVPASLLKYPPNNGGLSPLFGPQQVAMLNQLSQLSQLSQISQLQRLLMQQQKVQNQRSMPSGGRLQQDQQGRPLSMPQQMMQPPRQLDPNLMKQQAHPQQQQLHQPAMKSFLENFMPHHELQKEPPTLNSFSSFPIGGFPQPNLGQSDAILHQAVKHPMMSGHDLAPGCYPPGTHHNHSHLSPPLTNGHPGPVSPIHQRAGRKYASQESTVSARGLNSNLNVNNLDMGSINYKEPQSRLKKWTLDNISVNASLDQNSSKPGAISTGLRLEESHFGPYDFMNNSPASPPGSVGDGWPSRAKSPNGSSNVNWPPEFRPGEPWKGYPNIDPETDPYVTPGSVINNLSINTVRDIDHLRDRNNGSTSSLNTTLPSTSAWSSIRASNYSGSLSSTAQSTSARNSDSKSTWPPGPITNTSLAHELWKVPLPSKNITAPSRPPPGLTGQKPPSSWDNNSLRLGGGWGNSDLRYTPGSSWSDNSSGRTTNWLVLKNLTPQIDGSTLRTLCMQHGPLITFHLNLPHGNALVRYSSKEEAAKAQKSLHMCVLGNTTILAEFASEEEISRFFAQGQSMTPSPGWQALGSSHNRMGSVDGSHSFSNRNDLNHWNGAGLSGTGSGDLHGTSLWGTPKYSTSLWGTPGSNDTRGINSPSPINAFLPVDHLAGGGESM
ncbi:trinucleotide repeat-containing gene 6A protein-like isoform X4 [Acipenser ruthenus]|uniref:trinucleotide repeat-containing gene 6A protein-like isoform X4 n=1 Tax=Acipenser ruthenus TaxID=7906 RepID=UPI00274088FC|nr:trinucleotide repeat-containing gene 6A protein-like isoform X4 [Acipenser ruthenus]